MSQSNEICHANIFERIEFSEFRNIFWWIYAWYDVRCVNRMRLVNVQMLLVCWCCYCNFCSLCEQLNGSAEEVKRIAENRALHGTSISIFVVDNRHSHWTRVSVSRECSFRNGNLLIGTSQVSELHRLWFCFVCSPFDVFVYGKCPSIFIMFLYLNWSGIWN